MDLRPGFRAPNKGNPQQGTLFKASADELDPTGKRYPRGYTPERQDEVRQAVGDVGYSNFGTREAAGDVDGPMLLSEAEFGGMDPGSKRNWGEGRAVIRDSIARSTVPMDVVEKTNFAVTPNIGPNGLYFPRESQVYFGRNAEDAQAHREGFGTGNPTPETQRLNQGQTVIHELGHSADPALEPLRGKRNAIIDHHGRNPVEGYTEPPDLGVAEKSADDFAAEHFRNDPRAGRKETFDVATASYPGSYPDDIPPRHLAGYEGWGEKSERVAADLEPRHTAAEAAGSNYPKTADQVRVVGKLRDRVASQSPRLFER